MEGAILGVTAIVCFLGTDGTKGKMKTKQVSLIGDWGFGRWCLT